MEKPPFKPQLQLRIIGSIPIGDILEGEEIYRQLKAMFLNYSFETTLNGQIFKQLEPCCQDRKEQKKDEQVSHMA